MKSLKPPLVVASTVVLATALCLTGSSVANATDHGHQHGDAKWFTSWAQSQQDLASTTLDDQSVRMITHLSQGGDALRIRIQNEFGTSPLTIDAAAVGVSGEGAAIVGHSQPVTFPSGHQHASTSVTVPAGGQVWSNPVRMRTHPQDNIAVSMYVAGSVIPGRHRSALRDNYTTAPGAGNHVADTSGAAYTETVTSTLLVSAVDVHNTRLIGTIVPYGSSVVDGTGSTNCGPGCTITGNYQRWADDLARRVVAELPANQQFAVANEGIGGTTSSAECVNEPDRVKGLEANPRLERDVLALHGVTAVIYYYGTNDIQDNCTADQILSSYRQAFQRLHAAGIKVFVTPITPRPIYDDQMNVHRHAVNRFVTKYSTCSGLCDGIINFDQVLQDDLNPNAINLAYDNGDGIHANIAGQQEMADSIGLPLLVAASR